MGFDYQHTIARTFEFSVAGLVSTGIADSIDQVWYVKIVTVVLVILLAMTVLALLQHLGIVPNDGITEEELHNAVQVAFPQRGVKIEQDIVDKID